MPTVSHNGAEIYYETMGDGPPLLLIAGVMSDNASWGPIKPLLAKRYTLIMPDNRGCGRTRSEGAIAVDDMAGDCIALLDALGHDDAYVLGHSMGGAIALTLEKIAPARVKKLALAAAAAKPSARTVSMIDNILSLREAGAPQEHWLRAFFHWLFAPSFFENKNAVDAAIALSIAYPYGQSLEDMRRQVETIRAFDGRPLVAGLAAKTLLLAGELDHMAPPALIAEAYSNARHARLEILPGAAHSLHWDQPAAFAAAVSAFFSQ